MNFTYLHEFVTLADIGKYHEAADALYISQSSLSKHIQALERELGVSLFQRTTHKVLLTEFGAALLPHANKILEQQVFIEQEFQRLKHRAGKPLIVIGSTPVIPLYQLSNLISVFAKQNPCEVRIINQSASHLRSMLLQGICDFTVMYNAGVETSNELSTFPYTTDQLAVILPKTHRLAKQSTISLEQLEHETFVEVTKDPIAQTFLSGLPFSGRKLCPEIGFRVETVHQMMDLVSRGLAISFLGAQSVKHFFPNEIVTIPISPVIPLQVTIFYSKNAELRPGTQELFSFWQHASVET